MEIDSFGLLLGILVWLTVATTLIVVGLWARKTAKVQGELIQARIGGIEEKAWLKVDEMASRYEAKLSGMMTEARPFLEKVEGALDRLEPAITALGNIEAIPATVVAGLQPALKAFWNENVSPWATQMGNDALAQLDARIEKITLTLQPLVSVGAKVMGAAGGNAKAANTRNREVADNIRGRIPPAILGLLPKNLKVTEDIEELINGLIQFRPLVDRFAPGLLDQFLFGGGGAEGTVQPTGILGMPGIFPGTSVVKSVGTTDDLANYGK